MARQKKTAPEQVQDQTAPEQVQDGLVPMAKDGEVLDVHPSCVKAHESAGWKVVE